jgi:hypothetical protein
MRLISLEYAKHHLYVDHDEDDSYIGSLIDAASNAVLDYLKGNPVGQPMRDEQGRIMVDSSGDTIYQYDSSGLVISAPIRQATALLVGEFYKNREAEQQGDINNQYGYGYLPRPVTALLYPYRTPSLA